MQAQPDRKPIYDTIVSYSNVVRPFGNPTAFLSKTQEVAMKVIGDPVKVNAAMADLKAGMDLWRKAEVHPHVLHTPRSLMASRLQSHLARQAQDRNRVESFLLETVDRILEGFEVRFSNEDWPEWAASFFTWVAAIVPAKAPVPDPNPEAIGNTFSVGVLGDFGTGLYGAPVCQQSIEESKEDYSLMLHLGDVYYSATPDEVEQRFFQFWPNKAPLNRTMNGNHEMYNGGHSYFETMLPRFNQTAGCFAMQNDHWVLAALDTAYHAAFGGQEGVLDDAQMGWLQRIVQAAGPRRVVLFSHHQPFTQLDDNQGGNLLAQMEKYGLAGRIFAWYWGHEHRCLLYDPHPKYGFHGRCAGHAAFPESRPNLSNAPASPDFGSQWRRLPEKETAPAAWIYDTNNLYVPGFETLFVPNGFMRLEFDGEHLVEYVKAPDNANVWLKEVG